MTRVFLVVMALFFLLTLFFYLLKITPEAMAKETHNQRVVAAGSYRHIPGFYDYMQFAGNQERGERR